MTENLENKQIRKNLVFNVFNLLANIIIGLLYTPYLVKNLGIIAYGIIPLALVLNQYIAVLTNSLTSSLTRFYSVAIQQGRSEDASKCITTSLIVIVIIFIILSPILYYVVSYIDNVFTIPEKLIIQTKSLFTFTILSFFLSLVSSVFNITLYAYNKLDYLNIIKILRVSLKFIFVIILFYVSTPKITYVGFSNFITEFIILFCSLVFFFKTSHGLIKIKFKNLDIKFLIPILGMTFWVIINQIGDTGLYRIDTLITNKFWSTKESGLVGAFSEIAAYISMALSVITSLFGPIILIAFSKGDHNKVQKLSMNSSLLIGVLCAALVGILAGFSDSFTTFWLGEEFSQYSIWLCLKIFVLPFYISSGVFSFIYRSWNKVKIPAIGACILGLMNFGTAILIVKFLDFSNLTISILVGVGTLFGIIQSYILNGWYISCIYPAMKQVIIKNFFIISIVLIITFTISYIINMLVPNKSIISFIFLIILISSISLISALKFCFTKEQINDIISLIRK